MKKIRIKLILFYYNLQYLKAIIWTFLWGLWRWTISRNKHQRIYWHSWGHHESPRPIRCDCGWAGSVRNLIHGYREYELEDGIYDNEPVDECPRCGVEL